MPGKCDAAGHAAMAHAAAAPDGGKKKSKGKKSKKGKKKEAGGQGDGDGGKGARHAGDERFCGEHADDGGAAAPPSEDAVGDGDAEEQDEAERKKITKKELSDFNERQRMRGIIYMSRVPPFMKPAKVRHLMEQHGKVGKIFLRPEDEVVAKKRKKFGGNRKTNYVEGWVEFEDKRVARSVAAALNGTQVGGKKGSFHYDDIWSMLYLPKFKWHHLTERIAYENAVRQKRLQAEDAQVRRETNAYIDHVAKAKRSEALEKKGVKRPAAGDDAPVRRIKLRNPIPSKDD